MVSEVLTSVVEWPDHLCVSLVSAAVVECAPRWQTLLERPSGALADTLEPIQRTVRGASQAGPGLAIPLLTRVSRQARPITGEIDLSSSVAETNMPKRCLLSPRQPLTKARSRSSPVVTTCCQRSRI